MKIKIIVFCFLSVILLGSCNKRSVPSKSLHLADTLSAGMKVELQYVFSEATKQFIFGNYKEALTLYNKYLEFYSHSGAANYQVANIYMLSGDKQKSVEYSKKACKYDPKNCWYLMQLAKICQINNMNDSAVTTYKKILKLQPNSLEYKLDYANLCAVTKKYNEALDVLEGIEKEIGLNENICITREQIYIERKQFDLAEKEIQRLITALPGDARYLGMLAELYTSIHKNAKAVDLYNEIFAMDSSNMTAKISAEEFYRSIGEYGKANKLLEDILKDNEVKVETKVSIVSNYISSDNDLDKNKDFLERNINTLLEVYKENLRVETLKADFYIRAKQFDDALSVLDDLNEKINSNAIWEQIFYILNSLSRNDEIIRRAQEAISAFPEDAEIYLVVGMAYFQKEMNEKAIAYFENGIKYIEENTGLKEEFVVFSAEAYSKLESYEKADSCFDLAISLNDKNYIAMNNYSYYLAMRNTRLKDALRMSRTTVDANSDNAVYLDTYGYILFKMGKFKKAKKFVLKALNLNNYKDADIIEHYGDILFKLGSKNDALKLWNLAIEKGSKTIKIEDKVKEFEQ